MVENYKYALTFEKFMDKHATYHLSLAHHLLVNTYPLTHDAKLLLVAAEHLYTAADTILTKHFPQSQSFATRVRLLSKHAEQLAKKLRELHNVIKEHEESPLEFARHGHYIICDEHNQITQLTAPLLIDYLQDIESLAQSA